MNTKVNGDILAKPSGRLELAITCTDGIERLARPFSAHFRRWSRGKRTIPILRFSHDRPRFLLPCVVKFMWGGESRDLPRDETTALSSAPERELGGNYFQQVSGARLASHPRLSVERGPSSRLRGMEKRHICSIATTL